MANRLLDTEGTHEDDEKGIQRYEIPWPRKKGDVFWVNARGELIGEKNSHVQNSISILSNEYEHANLQAVI